METQAVIAGAREAGSQRGRSPHERSDMRGGVSFGDPGYRFAHPGYALRVVRSMITLSRQ
jgi:hypothetical protein